MALEGQARLEWLDGSGVVQSSTVLGKTASTSYERIVASVAVPEGAEDDWRPQLVTEKVGADEGFACSDDAQINPGELPCGFSPTVPDTCANLMPSGAGEEWASEAGSTQLEYKTFDPIDLGRVGLEPGGKVSLRWDAKVSDSGVAATLSVDWLDDAGAEVDPGGFLFPEADTDYRQHTATLTVPENATQMRVHALREENGGSGIAFVRRIQVNRGKEACEFQPPGAERGIAWATIAKIEVESCGTDWDISTAAYPPDNRVPWDNLDPGAGVQTSVDWKPDGTEFLTVGYGGGSPVLKRVSVPAAWDPNDHIDFVSQQNLPNVADPDRWPQGVFVRADGTKVYIAYTDQSYFDSTGTTEAGFEVREYTLGTAFDPTTISEVNILSLTHEPAELSLKDDGTKMYVVDRDNAQVVEYALSTAWDLSTASTTGAVLDVSSEMGDPDGPFGLDFKPDGTALVVSDTQGYFLYKYSLSTAWDLSTASYANDSLDLLKPGQTRDTEIVFGVTVGDSGSKIFPMTSWQDGTTVGNPELEQWEIDTGGQVFIKVAWDAPATNYEARVIYYVDGDRVGQNVVNLADGEDSFTVSGGSDGANPTEHEVHAVVGFGREETFTVFGEEITKFAFEVSIETDVETATWGTCT